MKVYVGCALALAPQGFVQKVISLKDILRTKFEVLDFLGFSGTERDVFLFDIEQVNNCDFMLAICDYPSTGLGFEIASVLGRQKEVIAVAHQDSKVSRMIIGINLPGFSFHRYTNLEEDIVRILGKGN